MYADVVSLIILCMHLTVHFVIKIVEIRFSLQFFTILKPLFHPEKQWV